MKTKEKSAAILTIKDAPNMSKRGRKSIADWLERQAGFLRRNGDQLSTRFTARYIYVAIIGACLICASLTFTGCKTPRLEVGGVYAPTNSVGEVIYNDIGLALADTAYKFSYETVLAAFQFERDNRQAIWELSSTVKRDLDQLRPKVVEIDRRWAAARRVYKANPTPAGLSTLQTILSEINRIVPAVQAKIAPVYTQLTIKH